MIASLFYLVTISWWSASWSGYWHDLQEQTSPAQPGWSSRL